VHRVARLPSEAAAAVFAHLGGQGSRYFRNPGLIRDFPPGEAALRAVIRWLPIRNGAADSVFNESAVELATLDAPREAERLVELMSDRSRRGWHHNPPELRYLERRAKAIAESMSADLKPAVDLDGLAAQCAGEFAGLNDRDATALIAARAENRCFAAREIDQFTALRSHEAANSDTELDASLRRQFQAFGYSM
jgi:hypothetical protein